MLFYIHSMLLERQALTIHKSRGYLCVLMSFLYHRKELTKKKSIIGYKAQKGWIIYKVSPKNKKGVSNR